MIEMDGKVFERAVLLRLFEVRFGLFATEASNPSRNQCPLCLQ